MFYRARWYDPSQGRFVTEDPVGYRSGLNLYSYVGNSPLGRIDPTGFGPDSPWWDPGDFFAGPTGTNALGAVGTFASGFADTLTFGGTAKVREWTGSSSAVDECSGWYTGGEVAGYAWDIAVGEAAAGGGRSFIRGAGEEWSHWIPQRYEGVPEWVRNSPLNGNYGSITDHALNDPYRYRFMPRTWKEANPINPPFVRQINRVPNWIKGAGVGAAAAGAQHEANGGKNCPCP